MYMLMSVEQPLPEEWLRDLDNDIPIRVEQDRLETLGFMKAEEDGSYESWVGGRYQLDYRSEVQEITDYELLNEY